MSYEISKESALYYFVAFFTAVETNVPLEDILGNDWIMNL